MEESNKPSESDKTEEESISKDDEEKTSGTTSENPSVTPDENENAETDETSNEASTGADSDSDSPSSDSPNANKQPRFDHLRANVGEIGKALGERLQGGKQAKEDQSQSDESSTEKDQEESEVKDSEQKEPSVKLDEELQKALKDYNNAYATMDGNGHSLYVERMRSADLIENIEVLINSIANRPKTFNTDFEEIKINREAFVGACDFAKEELDTAKKSALGAGAGVTTGMAVVSVAPSAAMWVATTFGTASTGTAISALSGAAASNAALAWLGGGALAAGGGGMAAGNALLALAGPIGVSFAGITLLASITLFTLNSIKNKKRKKEEVESIRVNTTSVAMVSEAVGLLLSETTSLRDNLNEMYREVLGLYEADFMTLPVETQLRLGTLVNNTKSLATLLTRGVDA